MQNHEILLIRPALMIENDIEIQKCKTTNHEINTPVFRNKLLKSILAQIITSCLSM